MENIYTILNMEGMSRTSKIQEVAMMIQPYKAAQLIIRLNEDNEALQERVLQLETEHDAFKLLLSAHNKVEEN